MQARLRGLDMFAEAQDNALFVGADPVKAAGEPEHEQNQETNQDTPGAPFAAAGQHALEPVLAPAQYLFQIRWLRSAAALITQWHGRSSLFLCDSPKSRLPAGAKRKTAQFSVSAIAEPAVHCIRQLATGHNALALDRLGDNNDVQNGSCLKQRKTGDRALRQIGQDSWSPALPSRVSRLQNHRRNHWVWFSGRNLHSPMPPLRAGHYALQLN